MLPCQRTVRKVRDGSPPGGSPEWGSTPGGAPPSPTFEEYTLCALVWARVCALVRRSILLACARAFARARVAVIVCDDIKRSQTPCTFYLKYYFKSKVSPLRIATGRAFCACFPTPGSRQGERCCALAARQ